MALAEAERNLESLPEDLKAAIEDGRISGSIVSRYNGFEKYGFFSWLMKFGGFKERLLADDLFSTKVGIECGVGLFTKTTAEYQRRKENFFSELEIVFADVVIAIIADFMLVYLPASGSHCFSSRPSGAQCWMALLSSSTAVISGCFVRSLVFTVAETRCHSSAKLLAVGTTSSLVGTVVTNALINARKAVHNSVNKCCIWCLHGVIQQP